MSDKTHPMSSLEQEIPSPPGLPWVGHLLQIPKSRITQYLLETSRGFDGILALDFAGAKLPFVFDPDLVAELSDPKRFAKTVGPPLSTLRRLAGDGLFTARSDEPNWGKAHRILLPAFGQRAMKGYFPMMLEVAQRLATRWEARGPDADIEVADDMTRLTLDTISLAGFGYRFDSFARDELHPFLNAMTRVLGEVMQRLTRLPIQNRLMKSSLERMDQDIAVMHTLVDEVIRARRDSPSTLPQRDLLDLMLQARDPITDEPLDNENIRSQVITFLIAGHETTSGLLTFALYLLMRHPEVLAQCHAEVDRVMPDGQTPRYEHLARLDVIERVLRETLRLWPTAPSYAVAPLEDTLLGGRYRLRKGQRVLVFLPALHRHPRHWARPEAFDIERFTPAARAGIHPHAYKPFGNGERACIGQQFALTEAKLALAVILQRFALSDPHDYRFAIKETLTLKPDGLRLRASPRVRAMTGGAAGIGLGTGESIPRGIAGAATVQARTGSDPDAPTARDPALTPGAVSSVGPAATATATAGLPSPTSGREPFQVLYGSSVGTCQEVAEEIAARARAAGFEPQVRSLDEGMEPWPTGGWLIAVTATYNGRAPDSARRLEALLDDDALTGWRAPGLRYAVLGCGNSQWPAYQAFPTRVAQALAASGATEVLARGQADGNADFDLAVEQWSAALQAVLAQHRPTDAATGARAGELTVTLSDPAGVRGALLPARAQAMQVLDTRELVAPAAGLWDFSREAPRPSTRHLRIALPASATGATDTPGYATGDHLAVYPHNEPARVQALIERLGLSADTLVTLSGDTALSRHLARGQAVALSQLLGEFVELQDPARRRDIEHLATRTRCPNALAALKGWLGEAAPAGARRPSVPALLLQYPAIEATLTDVLQTCAPMRPRWYSISSSARASPTELTLTVGLLEAPATPGQDRWRGVASRYLCELPAGQWIAAQVRTPSPDFAPPADPAQPMVLVGPGTGIAPFRGFIEELAWHRAQGHPCTPALLFTGARHPAHDALHADELAAWSAQGVVTVVAAYSSLPEHPWRFVQDALWAKRDDVWRLLQAGARFYLCGDGKAMAPAVRETLKRIWREHHAGDGDTAQAADTAMAGADAWLEALSASGRFRQDVFN